MSGLGPETPIRVGIGLVGRDGRYLVRRRPSGTVLAGSWEFPGGKCEPGESPEEAARRECLEEAGLAIELIRLRRRVVHRYAHGCVELSFFDGRTVDPAAEPDPVTGFVWVAGGELASLPFPEANGPIVEELSGRGRSGPGQD